MHSGEQRLSLVQNSYNQESGQGIMNWGLYLVKFEMTSLIPWDDLLYKSMLLSTSPFHPPIPKLHTVDSTHKMPPRLPISNPKQETSNQLILI